MSVLVSRIIEECLKYQAPEDPLQVYSIPAGSKLNLDCDLEASPEKEEINNISALSLESSALEESGQDYAGDAASVADMVSQSSTPKQSASPESDNTSASDKSLPAGYIMSQEEYVSAAGFTGPLDFIIRQGSKSTSSDKEQIIRAVIECKFVLLGFPNDRQSTHHQIVAQLIGAAIQNDCDCEIWGATTDVT